MSILVLSVNLTLLIFLLWTTLTAIYHMMKRKCPKFKDEFEAIRFDRFLGLLKIVHKFTHINYNCSIHQAPEDSTFWYSINPELLAFLFPPCSLFFSPFVFQQVIPNPLPWLSRYLFFETTLLHCKTRFLFTRTPYLSHHFYCSPRRWRGNIPRGYESQWSFCKRESACQHFYIVCYRCYSSSYAHFRDESSDTNEQSKGQRLESSF